MSEQEALIYQVEHHQVALVAFSQEYGVEIQIMLTLMAIYR